MGRFVQLSCCASRRKNHSADSVNGQARRKKAAPGPQADRTLQGLLRTVQQGTTGGGARVIPGKRCLCRRDVELHFPTSARTVLSSGAGTEARMRKQKSRPGHPGRLDDSCVSASLPRGLKRYFFLAFFAPLPFASASSSRAACAAASRATGTRKGEQLT